MGKIPRFWKTTPCLLTLWVVPVLSTAEGQDSGLTVEWSRAYGIPERGNAFHSVRPTSDGGYILGGFIDEYDGGGRKFYVMKADSRGETLWEAQCLQLEECEPAARPGFAYCAVETSDKGYVAAGEAEDVSVLIMKMDSAGYLQWVGQRPQGWASSVEPTSDGGYILACTSYVSMTHQAFLLKVDAAGREVWAKSYDTGGYESYDSHGYAARETVDGGYVLVGDCRGCNSSRADIYNVDAIQVVKTDDRGEMAWKKYLYGQPFPGASEAWGGGLLEKETGDLVIAGEVQLYRDPDVHDANEFWNVYAMKLSPMGDVIWERRIGASTNARLGGITSARDGGYVLAGRRESLAEPGGYTPCVWKLSEEGELHWESPLEADVIQVGTNVPCVARGQGDGYVIAGSRGNEAGLPTEACLLKLGRGDGAEELFVRGDANGDEQMDLSDAVFVLSYLFSVGAEPSCKKSGDVNDSGILDVSDAVYSLNYQFLEGPPPEDPFPDCGMDDEVDDLTCVSFPACR